MAERVLMKGNEAIAEAAIRAGCRHYFGYPITPQTEIAAYMAKKNGTNHMLYQRINFLCRSISCIYNKTTMLLGYFGITNIRSCQTRFHNELACISMTASKTALRSSLFW